MNRVLLICSNTRFARAIASGNWLVVTRRGELTRPVLGPHRFRLTGKMTASEAPNTRCQVVPRAPYAGVVVEHDCTRVVSSLNMRV
jgi:hypothetical protein